MNFRRYYIPNAIVFITNVVYNRQPVFADEAHMLLLRDVLRKVKQLHPFQMLAYVFLPDHFHLLLRPTGRSNFSKIMQACKINFTKQYKHTANISGSVKFWQKRFYDHVIRDGTDFERHIHYIHYNPVKHGYVKRPEEWHHSSFKEWKRRNAYPDRWGWSLPDEIAAINATMVE